MIYIIKLVIGYLWTILTKVHRTSAPLWMSMEMQSCVLYRSYR